MRQEKESPETKADENGEREQGLYQKGISSRSLYGKEFARKPPPVPKSGNRAYSAGLRNLNRQCGTRGDVATSDGTG